MESVREERENIKESRLSRERCLALNDEEKSRALCQGEFSRSC